MNINISNEVMEMNDKHIVEFMEDNDTKKLLKSFNGRTDIGFRGGMIILLNKENTINVNSGIQVPIRREKRNINTEHCINCTMKHLSSAAVQMEELILGYWGTPHEVFCMGNLNEASEQIYKYSHETALRIRQLRLDIFEKKKEATKEHVEEAISIYFHVKSFIDNPPQLQDEKKCGCNKKGVK